MYIKQAYNGYNEWWRYLITFFVLIMAQLIGAIPLQIVFKVNSISKATATEFIKSMNPDIIGLSQNASLIILMIPMVLTFFALVVSIKYIHGHSIIKVFTSAKSFRWKNFFFGFLGWGLLLVMAEIIYYQIHPENYVFNFNAADFFPLLLIALIMIPLQAGAEELYLRGNLMQGIGIFTRSRVIALLATSIIFGLLHLKNPEVKQFGIAISMSYYIGFGLFMGLLVLLDGGLEMPLAIHAINNIYGAVFVGYSGSVLQTPAMFKVLKYNPTAMLVLFVSAALLYIIISRKLFHWKGFSIILKTVQRD